MSDGQIDDAEVVYRRIPPGKDWLQPPSRITSSNFKLKGDELGISVYRAVAVDAAGVLSKSEAKPDSRIAQTTVGEIRNARNSKDELLGLDVIAINDANDPGHAEIRGPLNGVISNSTAKALQRLFKLVEIPPE